MQEKNAGNVRVDWHGALKTGQRFLHFTKFKWHQLLWSFMFYRYQSQRHCLTFLMYSAEQFLKEEKSMRSLCMIILFTNHASMGTVAPPSVTQFLWDSLSVCDKHTGGWRDSTKRLGSCQLISASLCVDTIFHVVCKKLQRYSASHSVG